MGYPVMNAELSAQIATGATVFPSELGRTGSPHPAPSAHAMPALQTGPTMPSGPLETAPTMPSGPHGSMGSAMPSGPHGSMGSMGSMMPSGPHGSMGSTMPSGPHESMGSMMPSGPHGAVGTMPSGPYGSMGAAPSGRPEPGALPGPPVPGPRGSEPGSAYDPQHPLAINPQYAAELMSPVGQQYPEHVDWSAAAASRARAIQPWMLAVLFVGAIGIALALTIVVARLIR